MKRYVFGCVLALAACDEAAMTTAGGGGGFRELLVIGSSMTFEQCRTRGGLIIRDSGSPMVACDPNVIRAPIPVDDFDNPTSNTAASGA